MSNATANSTAPDPPVQSPDRFCGRAFDPIAKGARVLVVTSPGLVWALLTLRYQGDAERTAIVRQALPGIMEAVQANPMLGVLAGTVEETGDRTSLGLQRLNVDLDAPETLVLETERTITEALGIPRRARRGMPAVPLAADGVQAVNGHDTEAFEREHPWIKRVGLNRHDQDALVASRAKAMRKPAKRYHLVFPDDAANRSTLRGIFTNLVQRIMDDPRKRGRRYARLS